MEHQGLSRRQVTQVVGLEVWWRRLKRLEAKEPRFSTVWNKAWRRARITN
jgi:hypothetical protein